MTVEIESFIGLAIVAIVLIILAYFTGKANRATIRIPLQSAKDVLESANGAAQGIKRLIAEGKLNPNASLFSAILQTSQLIEEGKRVKRDDLANIYALLLGYALAEHDQELLDYCNNLLGEDKDNYEFK